MDGNTFFYAVTLVAGVILVATAACCLLPNLRHRAKQGLFVGLVGGLLSLGLLSVIFMFQLMYFPWLVFGFFGLGFAAFTGCYFGARLLSIIPLFRRGGHA